MDEKDDINYLKIEEPQISDFGKYKCKTSNNIGTTERSIIIGGMSLIKVMDIK